MSTPGTPEREALEFARETLDEARTYCQGPQWSPSMDEQCARAVHRIDSVLAASPAAGGVQALTDERISHLWDTRVGEPTSKYPVNEYDVRLFARAVEAEVLAATPPAAHAVANPYIAGETVVSKPGAAIKVTQVHLSEAGKQALQTTASEIPAPASDEREALAVCPSCKGSGTRTYQHLDDYEEGDCDRCSGTGVLAARAPQTAVSGAVDPVGQPAGEQTGPVSAVPTPQAAPAPQPEAAEHGTRTGWPAGMLQDDSRELSRALSRDPNARQLAREAAEPVAAPVQPVAEKLWETIKILGLSNDKLALQMIRHAFATSPMESGDRDAARYRAFREAGSALKVYVYDDESDLDSGDWLYKPRPEKVDQFADEMIAKLGLAGHKEQQP